MDAKVSAIDDLKNRWRQEHYDLHERGRSNEDPDKLLDSILSTFEAEVRKEYAEEIGGKVEGAKEYKHAFREPIMVGKDKIEEMLFPLAISKASVLSLLTNPEKPREGKCMGCGLMSIVDDECTECGAKQEVEPREKEG